MTNRSPAAARVAAAFLLACVAAALFAACAHPARSVHSRTSPALADSDQAGADEDPLVRAETALRDGDPDRAVALLDAAAPPVGSPRRAQWLELLTRALLQRGALDEAGARWASEPGAGAMAFVAWLGEHERELPPQVERPATADVARMPWRAWWALHEARLRLGAGDAEGAALAVEAWDRDYAGRWPALDEQRDVLAAAVRRARGGVRDDVVGIAVPLSGPHARWGERVLRAVQVLQGEIRAAGVSVEVADTQGTPQGAGGAVEELAHKGAAVVVGPIGARESEAAAVRADQLGVPLVVLSTAAAATQGRQWCVAGRGTIDAEVARLAGYASGELKVRTVAAVAPVGAYGDEAIGALQRAASAAGLEVVAVERWKDGDDLVALAKRLAGAQRLRQGDPMPFDALFVPAGPAAVLHLLPYLDAVGLRFRTHPAHHDAIQLLGTRLWASPSIVDTVAALTDNAVFPGVWVPPPVPEVEVRLGDEVLGAPPEDAHAAEVDELWRAFRQLFGADPARFDVEVALVLRRILEAARTVHGAVRPRVAACAALGCPEAIAPRLPAPLLPIVMLTVDGGTVRQRFSLPDEVRLRSPASRASSR